MKKIIQHIIFIHRYFFPDKNEKNKDTSPVSPSTVNQTVENTTLAPPESVTPDKPDVEQKPLKPQRPFGEIISDAEHMMSRKLYKEALDLYRKLDKDLMGTGELMKIQFVRDRIESLLTLMKRSPGPESEDIIREEDLADLKEFDTILFEADHYYEHRLLNEALFLYRKLEKKWATKDDPQRQAIILNRISQVVENMDDPDEDVIPEPEEPVPVVFLDQEGSLTEQRPGPQAPEPATDDGASPSTSLLDRLLNQKMLLNLMFVVLVGVGIFSTYTRTIENLPPVDMGEVIITTYYQGASAKDVENLVTVRIENIVEGMDHVEEIRSRSYRNVSSVAVAFSDHSDYRELFSRLRTRVLSSKKALPAGCDEPDFLFIDSQWLGSVMRIDLFGEASETTRRWLAEKLKTQISAIEGIRSVAISGEAKNEFVVALSPEKLQAAGVTFSQTAQALRAAGTNISTGSFDGKSSEFILDAGHVFSGQSDVVNTIIQQNEDGSFVRVADVMARAKAKPSSPSRMSSFNGNDSVSLTVHKEENASTIDLVKEIKTITGEFQAKHRADGIRIAESSDSSLRINRASGSLRIQMLIGLGLILVFIGFSLGLRPLVLSAVIIPFALLTTLVAMKISGMSVNSINLVAFILISAAVVDLAIMVMESMSRQISRGKPVELAIRDAVRELYRPLIGSLVIMAVTFLPLFLISGPTGDLLIVIPITIILMLAAACLGSLGFLPSHVYQWAPREISAHEAKGEHDVLERYEGLLDTCLKRPSIIVGTVALICILGLTVIGLNASGSMRLIPFKPFPEPVFRYHVTLAFPASTSIYTTHKAIVDLSTTFMAGETGRPESIAGMAGYFEGENRRILQGNQYGQMVISLPGHAPDIDPQNRVDRIRTNLKAYLEQAYPKAEDRPKASVFPEQNRLLTQKPLVVHISGQTLEREIDVSDRIIEYIEKQAGENVVIGDGRTPRVNVVKYLPNQEKAFEKDVSPAQITEFISGALNGIRVGIFRAASEEMDLKVRIDKDVKNPRDMLNMPIGQKDGNPVLLHHVVTVRTLSELDSRGRYNGKPTVTLTAHIRPGSGLSQSRLSSLVTDYYAGISEAFPDVTVTVDETIRKTPSFKAFMTGALVVLLVMYIILALCLNDYIQPLIVMAACLMTVALVTLILTIGRVTVSVWSLMALAGLCFVTLNTAVVIIYTVNRHIMEGLPPRDAVLMASLTRMKPALVTAIALTLGFLPMALGLPSKWAPWSSMGRIMVMGLIPTTCLILLAVPVLCDRYVLRKHKPVITEKEDEEDPAEAKKE